MLFYLALALVVLIGSLWCGLMILAAMMPDDEDMYGLGRRRDD